MVTAFVSKAGLHWQRRRTLPLLVVVVVLAASVLVAVPPAGAFDDVEPDTFYEDPVWWLVSRDITTGTTRGTCSPELPVTRAQMATFLWRYAGSPGGFSHDFADVEPGRYYVPAVGWMKSEGITTGTAPGQFSPDALVTRAQMATFLPRVAGEPAAGGHSFVDVPSGVYFDDAVAWLSDTGITTGFSPDRYGPEQLVTRGQMATFLYRLRDEVPVKAPVPPVVLTDRSLGIYRVGMTVRAASALAGAPLSIDGFTDFDGDCYWADLPGFEDDLVSVQVFGDGPGSDPRDGVLSTFYVNDPTIRTDRGAYVGMAVAELLAAYPQGLRQGFDEYSGDPEYDVIVDAGEPSIRFTTAGGLVTAIQAGTEYSLIEGCA